MPLPTLLRWLARLGSLVSLTLLAAFAFGGRESGWPTPIEWVGLLCFPLGMLAGLLLAWRYELTGALVALGSLLLFFLWASLRSGQLAIGPYFLIFTSPALAFLAASLLDHRRRPRLSPCTPPAPA